MRDYSYIPISYLNDYIFCPRSIYFHSIYYQTSKDVYNSSPQIRGLESHKAIDNKTYSTKKNVLQSYDVYSNEFQLHGKIDIYDIDKNSLWERKHKIIKLYDGYIFQVYAQYFSLVEMGYDVKKIFLYSISDNKKYPVDLPNRNSYMFNKFAKTIRNIKTYNIINDTRQTQNKHKCQNCIYSNLCDISNI